MTNETTASQPKSIGDDAIEAAALKHVATSWGMLPAAAYRSGDYKQTEQFKRLKAFALELLDSRAPAAQASATIQAAFKATDEMCIGAREKFGIGATYSGNIFNHMMSLATIQEPVMVAEPVAYADPKAFDNFSAGTATNEWMWAKPDAGLVPLYRAAPMVADPDGVALSDEQIDNLVCGIYATDYQDDPAAYDRAIFRAALAATVKAVPSEALEGCEHCLHTYCLSSEICRHCGDVNGTQGYKGGKLAAPLADKTGGGE